MKEFSEGFINIKYFGAKGDGVNIDDSAFQEALKEEFAKVYIPEGIYIISVSLKLKSGTQVLAHPKAIIRLADKAGISNEICLLCNYDSKRRNKDISVDGGTWDANCPNNTRGEEFDPKAYSGVGISFINVRGLQLRNMTVANPDSFYIRIGEVENFHFENIKFKTCLVRPNQDGIHIGGFCRNGLIRDIQGMTPNTPNDDMIAINADDDVTRHFTRGMKCGTIENIIVENIKVISTFTFIRLLSCGSVIKNILIRNISGAVDHYAINAGCWRFPKGTGLLENIFISNANISKLDDPINLPLILINSRTNNFVIDNFIRNSADNMLAPTLNLNNDTVNSVSFESLSENQIESLKTQIAGDIHQDDSHLSGTVDNEFILREGSIKRFSIISNRK